MALGRYFQVERGWNCLVVEKESAYGLGISSRNSEVLHTGIYYPTGSLKAQLCVSGVESMYRYLRERNLPHRRCGKYILAAPDSEERLQQLHDQGRENGVPQLVLLEPGAVQNIYPELRPLAALYSPNTGILSADGLLHQLAGEFRAADGDLALKTSFTGLSGRSGQFELSLPGLVGVGEGSLFVAKEFRFEEVVRQRGTVDLHEATGVVGRVVVDRLGDEVFAGARLAGNQDD